MLNLLKSPWTWEWFRVRRCDLLARFSWCLFSNDTIGWRRPAGSILMGQYNLVCPSEKPRSLRHYLMTMVKKLVRLFGVEEEKIFWLSKLLFTEYTEAKGTMQILLWGCYRLNYRRLDTIHHFAIDIIKNVVYRWIEVRGLDDFVNNDFDDMILVMHVVTEVDLRKHYSEMNDATSENVKVLVKVCRHLSHYMMYLLVTHPSLLPLRQSTTTVLETWELKRQSHVGNRILERLETRDLPSGVETLEGLQDWWIHMVAYAGGKSRPEMHASMLARGGEPLTFVWLLLAHLDRNGLPTLTMYRGLRLSDLWRID
ncbi:hypothetical protein ACP4OV_027035 [Aristida adscensionis]